MKRILFRNATFNRFNRKISLEEFETKYFTVKQPYWLGICKKTI